MTQQANRWREIGDVVTRRMRVLRIADQAELIRRSGGGQQKPISQPTAQQYMTGAAPKGRELPATPRASTIAQIAQALQWPPDWWQRFDDIDLVNWSHPSNEIRLPDDLASRIQFDAGLGELGAVLASLQDRVDRSEHQLALLAERVENLETEPAQRGTRPSR